MPLTPQQEFEILPILDSALAAPLNKAVIYRCSISRASYLARMINGLRYDSAIESIQMYKPDEPLYGLGLYSNLLAEPHEAGLVVANLPQPTDSLVWRFIQALATTSTIPLEHSLSYARTRLHKLQKKHPEMLALWIDDYPEICVKCGKPAHEELVTVDIDIDPTRPVPAPTDEDYAKARQSR